MLVRVAIALLFLAGAVHLGQAAPLDVAQCEALRAEQAQLEGKGARVDLGRGAQWGKANLQQPRLDQVEKLITIDEQLLFRCANPRPIIQLKDEPQPEDTPADDVTAAKKPLEKRKRGGTAAVAVPAPVPAAKAPEKPAPAAVPPASAAQPRKARPKADDAYRPPAGTESVLTPPPGGPAPVR
jgi:hypothetical protein